MMKHIYFLLTVSFSLVIMSGCKTTALCGKSKVKTYPNYSAIDPIKLMMPDGFGENGGGVTYCPKTHTYMATFAGNEGYPLGIFDEKGVLLNKDNDYTIGFDARSLWYNAITKQVEGNAYDRSGIFGIGLDAKGFPKGVNNIFDGMHQPNANSSGAYDSVHNEIVYWHEGIITRYNRETGGSNLTYKLTDFADSVTFNLTTALYTYLPKQEIGLLDATHKKVYLFDRETGKRNAIITLPNDSPTFSTFNVAYTNNRIWLFDKANRTWIGYKLEGKK